MRDVVMYLKPTCPYCVRAEALLAEKGVTPERIDIRRHPDRRDEMIERACGRRTVPQIFVGEHHVGGCDDLHDLEAAGELDYLLGLDGAPTSRRLSLSGDQPM